MTETGEPGETAGIGLQASCVLPVQGGTLDLRVYGIGDEGPERVLAAVHRADPPRPRPLVRLHSSCATGDILGSLRCDCGSQLTASVERVLADDHGVLLYLLRQEGRGIGLANKIRAYALQERGLDTVQANLALNLPVDRRDYAEAVEVLRQLGVDRARLVTNNPAKVKALEDGGVRVLARVPIGGFVTEHNADYLAVKDHIMGHLSAAGTA
ncbi:GTP cyclohydrolase II RibA [Streptomyces sp. M19]